MHIHYQMQSKALTSKYKFSRGLSLMYFEPDFFFGLADSITWYAPANNYSPTYWGAKPAEPHSFICEMIQ